MCRAGVTVEEVPHILMQGRIQGQQLRKVAEFLRRGQPTVDQKIGDLYERGLLGQNLDRDPAVVQNAGVAVDEGDVAGHRPGVHEPLIEGHVASLRTQLANIDGLLPFRPHHNRQLKHLAVDLQFRGVWHGNPPQ